MKCIKHIDDLRAVIDAIKKDRKTIGLVPTMGAIHQGHIKLIEAAAVHAEVTIVSIFVNPLQFTNADDYKTYPRNISEDIKKLERTDVEIVFAPNTTEMYPTDPLISLNFGHLSKVMEGKYRKGHFEGVGVIVTKLFHITQPDFAFFGLKDLQQYLLVKRLIEELNFPIELVGIKTIREKSGLALSSRNRLLSKEGLLIATNIYRGLNQTKDLVASGVGLSEIKKKLMAFFQGVQGLSIEYIEFVHPSNLYPVDQVEEVEELAVCIAGYVEGVRLIDNIYLHNLISN